MTRSCDRSNAANKVVYTTESTCLCLIGKLSLHHNTLEAISSPKRTSAGACALVRRPVRAPMICAAVSLVGRLLLQERVLLF